MSMDIVGPISSVWLTVNRQCNFRCVWCYAEGTNYQQSSRMSLEMALSLVALAYQAGARNLLLLGGEPTLWKELENFIRRANTIYPDMRVVVVSNGLLFSSKFFLKKMEGLRFEVGLSVKAGNESQHRELTKTRAFGRISESIGLLADRGLLAGVSVTVSSEVVDNLEEIAEMVFRSGASALSFEMCAPTFDSENHPQSKHVVDPRQLAKKIVKSYGNLMRISRERVAYQLSVPFCLFPEGFVAMLKNRGQIISGCHVMRRDGLIFDTHGGVLLCNCLYGLSIGQYGSDFHNYSTWRDWWERKEVKEVNERLLRYPSSKCVDCDEYRFCGGGCCLQWFSFDPGEILG